MQCFFKTCILFFALFSFAKKAEALCFNLNDSVIVKNADRIIISFGSDFNLTKRDPYYPYCAYDKFYTPVINDSTNFYKNAFGFKSRFRPSLEISYSKKSRIVNTIGVSYWYEKDHAKIGGDLNNGNSSWYNADLALSYSFKAMFFTSKCNPVMIPFAGFKLPILWRDFKYTEGEDNNGLWQDTVNFSQKLLSINLSVLVGANGAFKNIYYYAGMAIGLFDFVNSNYEYSGIYRENYPVIVPERKEGSGSDWQTIFLINTKLFFHIGYCF